MKLLILFGAPAVGKTTIGKMIEAQTDFKLFHNHMVMDGVMHIFGIGTPPEDRLSKMIRTQIIEEAAKAKIDLIFTYVWNFSRDKGKNNIDRYKQIYEDNGGEVLFVELVAPLEIRAERADDPLRRSLKTHAPNRDRVVYLEDVLDCKSPTPFYYPEAHHQINTANKTPLQITEDILKLLEV